MMRVLLVSPSEEACEDFQGILTNPHYYSDADEDGDVCYTVFEPSENTIRDWIERAKASRLIDEARILEDE